MYHKLCSLLREHGNRVSVPSGLVEELARAYAEKSRHLKSADRQLAALNEAYEGVETERLDGVVTKANAEALTEKLRQFVAESLSYQEELMKSRKTTSDPKAFYLLGQFTALSSELIALFEQAE